MTDKNDDSFPEHLPERFHLRPRDTAYTKVADVFEHVSNRILGFQPDYPLFDRGEEVEFDDEVWDYNGNPPRNEVILESIDSVISIRGLSKAKVKTSKTDHDLLLVTFYADASEIVPWDGCEIEPGETKKGFGEVVFGREMTPVVVANRMLHYTMDYIGGEIISDVWSSIPKVEITDRDAERIVAKLVEMQDDVNGYDPSTFEHLPGYDSL
jgi:hypothetical protein